MTEQERKHLGAWSTNLPSPTFNNLRVCLINLFKQYRLTISVNDLLNKVIECVNKKGGDTDAMLKVIGLYKGEFIEVQDLEEFKEEKQDFRYKPKSSPPRDK